MKVEQLDFGDPLTGGTSTRFAQWSRMSSAALNIQIGARPVDPTVADSIFNIFGRQKATGPKRREMLIFRRFFFFTCSAFYLCARNVKIGEQVTTKRVDHPSFCERQQLPKRNRPEDGHLFDSICAFRGGC